MCRGNGGLRIKSGCCFGEVEDEIECRDSQCRKIAYGCELRIARASVLYMRNLQHIVWREAVEEEGKSLQPETFLKEHAAVVENRLCQRVRRTTR